MTPTAQQRRHANASPRMANLGCVKRGLGPLLPREHIAVDVREYLPFLVAHLRLGVPRAVACTPCTHHGLTRERERARARVRERERERERARERERRGERAREPETERETEKDRARRGVSRHGEIVCVCAHVCAWRWWWWCWGHWVDWQARGFGAESHMLEQHENVNGWVHAMSL